MIVLFIYIIVLTFDSAIVTFSENKNKIEDRKNQIEKCKKSIDQMTPSKLIQSSDFVCAQRKECLFLLGIINIIQH